MLQDGLYFLSGKDYRNIFGFLRTGNVLIISEILFECLPEKKKERIESLILSGCRDTALNSEMGQIFLDILR